MRILASVVAIVAALLAAAVSSEHVATPYAWTAIFYTGTPRDWEYFCALRVMFETVRATGTTQDRVALLEETAPAWIRERLHKDGIITMDVPNIPNPYENRKGQEIYQDRFVKVFNKLATWKLTQYKSVAMLDSDLLFLANADEVFRCGDFCAIFVNPCIFHTGLCILKPSEETLKDMISKFEKSESYDGGDQGFLNSYFSGVLDAPLFRPPGYVGSDGKAVNWPADNPPPLARLPFGYHMDGMYYMQRFRWEVPCSDQKVIGFPGVKDFKPWFWWTWPFLPLAIKWHDVCRAMDECGASTATLAAFYGLAFALVLASLKISPVPLLRRVPLRVRMLLAWGLMFYAPLKVLPTVMHPHAGWPLFFTLAAGFLTVLTKVMELPYQVAYVWVLAAASIFVQGLNIFPTVIVKAFSLVGVLLSLCVLMTWQCISLEDPTAPNKKGYDSIPMSNLDD
jgi:hypothetical protein